MKIMGEPIKTVKQALQLVKDENIRFIDLRFTDTRGKEQHVSIPVNIVDQDFFEHGKMFDGSSISGWKSISSSDLVLMPDISTLAKDPFYDEPTFSVRCNVVDPETAQGYTRDPRSVAARAEKHLKATGIADCCYFGPEPEFFIFDDARWDVQMNRIFFTVDSKEAAWNSATEYETGNMGHRPTIKGGYFPVPPVDSSQDLRSTISVILENLGILVEAHHHEVATGNQNEISIVYDSLLRKADQVQVLKYVVHNVAHAYGKTATFMPKPLVGDNGNGMHCHQSLAKDGYNLFVGDQYAGLSTTALYYIGGILKHARALNAFTNSATNSYKRLLPGFEAPVLLAYSACNRSAAIRIPYVSNPKTRRIEVRFPDAVANPYLAFSAMLMAGLDGIENKIHPGDAMDMDLYALPLYEQEKLPCVCTSLLDAINALQSDYEFLLKGDVFTKDLIDAYVDLKKEEIEKLNRYPHPIEFDMYYSQ
jgi:glutamine synthetase